MKEYRFRSMILARGAVFACCLAMARVSGGPGDSLESQLAQVAAHVEVGDWNKAKAAVEEFASDQPTQTSPIWNELRLKLGAAAHLTDGDANQRRYRAEVAVKLGLYDVALQLCVERMQLLRSDQELHHARMDTAEMARNAGLDAVRKADYVSAQRYYEMVAEYGYSWVKELGTEKAKLIAEFAKDPEDVAVRIKFAKTFWVGQAPDQMWHYADAISMLEKTLASSRPLSVDQRKDIYLTIRGFCAGDVAAAQEWGDRILAEFPEDSNLVARIYVDEARRAYEQKDWHLALQHYRYVCENLRDSGSYGLAQFNVGMILKEQRQYMEAIREFQKLLTSNVNDHDPTGNIMAPERNYRPRAQWEIGNCYRAMGRFREALDAYIDAEKKYPFQSWCGNGHAEFSYRYALYQGLCYEYLGDYYAAVVQYWGQVADGSGLYDHPAIHTRLVQLYTSVGQVKTLVGMLDEIDDRRQLAAAKHLKRPLDEEMREKIRPSRTIREILRIRDLGARRQWPELIALLRARGTVAGPEEVYARDGNWQAVEAVKVLAEFPVETVPLLIEAARRGEHPDMKWLYFALGSCGTQPALDYLVERAAVEENIWPLQTIVFSLNVAGKPGRQRLEQLSLTAEANLAAAIRAWREGRFTTQGDFEFPPLPTEADLPSHLGAIDLFRGVSGLLAPR